MTSDEALKWGAIIAGAFVGGKIIKYLEANKSASIPAAIVEGTAEAFTSVAEVVGVPKADAKKAAAAKVKGDAGGVLTYTPAPNPVAAAGAVVDAINVAVGVSPTACAIARANNDIGGVLVHCSTRELINPSISFDESAADFWSKKPAGVFYGD